MKLQAFCSHLVGIAVPLRSTLRVPTSDQHTREEKNITDECEGVEMG